MSADGKDQKPFTTEDTKEHGGRQKIDRVIAVIGSSGDRKGKSFTAETRRKTMQIG
jgi:hypothetical protein